MWVEKNFINEKLTNSSSLSVALGTADVKPAFLLVAAIVYIKELNNLLQIRSKY